MNKVFLYILSIFTIFPILGCQENKYKTNQFDNNSYINDFKLLHENPSNENRVKIKSPMATIDAINNNIEILTSSIEILNGNGQDIKVISGNSSLNSSSNLIRVFNNVTISLLDEKNYFITTDSFYWNLNKNNIDLDSPLDINFENTKISSSGGSYDIKSGILKINNNIFTRSIYNTDGEKQFQLEIISDMAKWVKNKNVLEFSSNNKQVETTINLLSIK